MTNKKSQDAAHKEAPGVDTNATSFLKRAEEGAREAEKTYAASQERSQEITERQLGTKEMPKSPDGTPMTQFEIESKEFFAAQNEMEEKIDQIEVSPEQAAMFAGTDVNVLQSGGTEQPFGSATVPTYTGETINPYPPTDYAHVAIASGDLTNNPLFGTAGLIVGDPFPPENLFEDARETDGRNDLKDYCRRLRLPEFAIVEAYRTKYGGSYPENPLQ